MAVDFGNATESHTGTTGNASTATFTWNHSNSALGRCAIVFVLTIGATDLSTGVTYDGVAMSRIGSSVVSDTATEVGTVACWFLDNIPATASPAIVVSRTNSAVVMYAVCVTMTATGPTAIAGVTTQANDGAIAEVAINDGSPGRNSMRLAAAYTGAANPPTAGANSTLLHDIDLGAFGFAVARETNAGQGSRSVGLVAGSDDRAYVLFAVTQTSDIFTKTGMGVAPRTGSGADVVSTAETGTAISAWEASGPKRFNGIDYVKAGIAVMGSITGNVFTKAGAAISELAAAGLKALTAAETGGGIAPFVASGPDVATVAKTGAGVSERTGSGAEVTSSAETGAGVSERTGSGADAKTSAETGAGAAEFAASGADAVTTAETGLGVMGAPFYTYTKTGAVVSERTAAGADAVTRAETGAAVSVFTGSGAKAKTSAETGVSAAVMTGSGSDVVTFTEAGLTAVPFTGSGAKTLTGGGGGTVYTKTGLAVMGTSLGTYVKTGTAVMGSATGTYVKSGAAVSSRVASGADAATSVKTGRATMGGTLDLSFTKTGTAVSARVASGADAVMFVETSDGLDFPEPPSLDGPNPAQIGFGASGSKTVTLAGGGTVFSKTGTGVRAHTGSGADVAIFSKTGGGGGTGEFGTAYGSGPYGAGAYGSWGGQTRSASGTKAFWSVETSASASAREASGDATVTSIESGSAIVTMTGSGAKAYSPQATLTKTGTAIVTFGGRGFSAGSHHWLEPHQPTGIALAPQAPPTVLVTPKTPDTTLLTPKLEEVH